MTTRKGIFMVLVLAVNAVVRAAPASTLTVEIRLPVCVHAPPRPVIPRRPIPVSLTTTAVFPPAVAAVVADVGKARALEEDARRAARSRSDAASASRLAALAAASYRAEEAALAALAPIEGRLDAAGWLLDGELRASRAVLAWSVALRKHDASSAAGDAPGPEPRIDARDAVAAWRAAAARAKRGSLPWVWARYAEGAMLDDAGEAAARRALGEVAATTLDPTLAEESSLRLADALADRGDVDGAAEAYARAAAGPEPMLAVTAGVRGAEHLLAHGRAIEALSSAMHAAARSATNDAASRSEALAVAARAIDLLGDAAGAHLPPDARPELAGRALLDAAAGFLDGGALTWAAQAVAAAIGRAPALDAEAAKLRTRLAARVADARGETLDRYARRVLGRCVERSKAWLATGGDLELELGIDARGSTLRFGETPSDPGWQVLGACLRAATPPSENPALRGAHALHLRLLTSS